MINILKLRKLEKEKNTNTTAVSEVIDKKAEEITVPEKQIENVEHESGIIISEETAKKKTQKKPGKKVKSESRPKAKVKKEDIEDKKEPDLSEKMVDNNAEIKELMNEISEIENELKVLEEEDISKENNFLIETQAKITQNENPDKPEIKVEEIKVEEKSKPVTVVEIDHAEILRQNLLKELLAEESKSKTEVKSEPKKEPEKAQAEIKQIEIKQVIVEQEVSTKYETSELPKPAVDTLKEKPIEQINQIISAVQKNEFSTKEDQKKKTNENIVQLVGFMLSNEYYGVDIMKIREIIRMVDITKVPRSPKFIEGVINLRGSVIPVINLRTKVRMQRLGYDKNTRIVIVEVNGTVVGFIVDAVREVLRIQENLLEPPPSITIEKADYITSVAKLEDQLVILMDTEKVLSNEEGKALTEISKQK